MSIILLSETRRELKDSIEYYETLNPNLAMRFLHSIAACLDLAGESPLRFPLIDENVRRVLAPIFPYATLYSIENGRIIVLAVMHCARKPGYWKSRQ